MLHHRDSLKKLQKIGEGKAKANRPAVQGRGARISHHHSRPYRSKEHRFSVRFFYFDIFNCGPVPRLVILRIFIVEGCERVWEGVVESALPRGEPKRPAHALFFSASLLQQMSHSHCDVPIKNKLERAFLSRHFLRA